MEGEDDSPKAEEVPLGPREHADYSAMTLGFVAGVGISIIATIALIVTKLT